MQTQKSRPDGDRTGPALSRSEADQLPGSEGSRTARKRQDILNAATSLFLEHGYQGTSMDQVAALAAVSKQTVYKHFSDKERLFRAIVLGITSTVDAFIADLRGSLADPDDLETQLRGLALRYLEAVMQPRVLQLRRILIAEANRFPGLGRAYYERGPQLVIAELATRLENLAARGLLVLDDSSTAAQQLAYLILSIPLDRAMICGEQAPPPSDQLTRIADGAVDVFLAAYGASRRRPAADGLS